MADTVDVSPTADQPTHHISLTDGVNTLGLILCDRSGKPTNLSLHETPVPPTVTRVANTDSGYADFEQPYSVTQQADWSGGRGQEIYEKDTTRFADSNMINTWHEGQIICGPKPTKIAMSGAGRVIFFEYLGSLFGLQSLDTYAAPKLYINGLRGLAASNAGDLGKTHTTRSLSGINLAGKIIKIISGLGWEEETTWRTITSNTQTGTNDTITVSPAWNITQDATTLYVILGMDTFTEITGHGLTKMVTDVCVVDDFFYVLQGDSAAIRRGHLKADETWEWGDEGTNKGTFFELIADKTGKRQIWKAHLTDVEVADAVAWPNTLTFGSPIACGNKKSKITNLIPYSDPQKPYIMKEDCFGSVADSIWGQIPLGEMAAVRGEENGRAACQADVYLYFSLRQGLERYYQGKLDDIGPDRDSGMAFDRVGSIRHLVPYPAGLIACIDAGSAGYSSVLHWNKVGWHEMYRGPSGKRIRRAYIQSMPNGVDRLWISEDDNIVWLPLTKNPLKTNGTYPYVSGGAVDSSYIYTSLAEVVKYWSSIKVFSENLAAGARYVAVYYRVDGATAWTLAGNITQSPSQEIALGSHNVTGRRLQYRLILYTNNDYQTPRVQRVLVEGVQRIPPKRVWTVNFYVADEWGDLNGTELTAKCKAYTDQLRTWADSRSTAVPILMHSNFDVWDGIYVFIEPASIQPIIPTEVTPERSLRLVGQMTLREA